ncbi:MAG TPA: hypothetical protein VJC39_00090 [Candidatus Nanoarchaeia archaeon]|nr:hypothetical protein [Candidatus Nanoarchaeia archaeon]
MVQWSASTEIVKVLNAKVEPALTDISVRNRLTYAFIKGIRDFINEYRGQPNFDTNMPNLEITPGDGVGFSLVGYGHEGENITREEALGKLDGLLDAYMKAQHFLDPARNQMDYGIFSIVHNDELEDGKIHNRNEEYPGGTAWAEMMKSQSRLQAYGESFDFGKLGIDAQWRSYLEKIFWHAPQGSIKANIKEGNITHPKYSTIWKGYQLIAMTFETSYDKPLFKGDVVKIHHLKPDVVSLNSGLIKPILEAVRAEADKYKAFVA